MHIQLRELPGRLVIDATGAVLGRIRAPMVDMETWQVETLRVSANEKTAGDLGLAWTWWSRWLWWLRPSMEVPTGLIHAAGDAIILRVSLAELREANPAYLEDVEIAAIH